MQPFNLLIHVHLGKKTTMSINTLKSMCWKTKGQSFPSRPPFEASAEERGRNWQYFYPAKQQRKLWNTEQCRCCDSLSRLTDAGRAVIKKHWHLNWEVSSTSRRRTRRFLQRGSFFCGCESLLINASIKLSSAHETMGTLNEWCEDRDESKHSQAERRIKRKWNGLVEWRRPHLIGVQCGVGARKTTSNRKTLTTNGQTWLICIVFRKGMKGKQVIKWYGR